MGTEGPSESMARGMAPVSRHEEALPGAFGARLRALDQLVGTVVTVPCAALAELAAASMDFVWIDLEHGALGTRDVQPLSIAARAGGCAALVRLPRPDAERLTAILDAGVDGVVAPRIETVTDAERLVTRLRYPPDGSRGFAARRARGYGTKAMSRSPLDREIVCMAQIESPGAVEAADAIAAIEGVDALVIGCADLALALDVGLDLRSPRLREAIRHVQEAAEGAGIASGLAGPDDPALLADLSSDRSTLFVFSADVRIYAAGMDNGVAALKRELAPRAPEQEDLHVRT